MNTPMRAVRSHMRLCAALSAAVVAAGLLASSPVAAATRNVDANDNRTFSPQNVTSAVGGSVHWTASGVDDHSVHQNSNVFDSGNPGPGLNFTRTFSAGTFAYQCEEHGDRGMRGTIRVPPQALSAPAGLNFTVRWAAAGTNTGNRFDVMYRVGSGPWKTWRNNTSAKSMVFGARSQPVRVARGKSYSFKVRSGEGTGARQSGFSPVKSFRAS
jgi:plastocyanin